MVPNKRGIGGVDPKNRARARPEEMNQMYKEVVSIVPEEEAQDAPQASDM